MTPGGQRCDYLVIGGGTAGCIMAARLSEDPAVKVILLEAGPEDTDPWIHIPAGYARLFASQKYDWKFQTEAEPELRGRKVNWPRGKVLGGSGSINGLVFLRGSPHDYDRWAQSGARGWSYADVLPTFQRLEDWQGAPNAQRGTGGPVPVSEPRDLCDGAAAFVEACVAAGFPRHADINADAIEGVAPIQMNVRRGRRVSTAQAYLKPARSRPNVQVFTKTLVSRLLIEDGRATGCLARRDGAMPEEFHAAREVILCAGAIVSPQLLMLSGIGDGAALQALGLPVRADRPQVGQNLQDHFIARLSFRTKPAGTMNERAGTLLRQAWMAAGYALTRAGPMAVGATEATLFAKVTPGAEEAEVQYQFVNFSLKPNAGYTLAAHPGFMFNFGQCRPDSRGELRLRSPDPTTRPLIRANYLSALSDQRVMLEGARVGQRIAATPPFKDLVLEDLWPGTPPKDDAAMLDFIRDTGTTVYHPCGTCRMGSDDAAIVDPRLRVRGVQALRVVDASVFPLVPSSNIQPAVMMVAERAAAMVREDARASGQAPMAA
jgi:choline dehydrogenase